MRRQRQDNVILNPGKPSRPSKGCFPFSLSKGKQERDSLTVGPYQVGIIIWDGTVLDVFSGGTQPLPKGDVQTYIASTAPFNLAFRLKVPWESSEPDDLVLDPPLVTADGEHVTGRIDLTFSVTTKGVDGTLVTSGDTYEGAHRLLQLLGLYGEIITTSDVAEMIKRELLPKLLAFDLNEYKADELRSNRRLLRDFARSLETELDLKIDHFGLQLIDFHLNWDIHDRKPQHLTGIHPVGVESNENGDSGSTPLPQATWGGDSNSTPLHEAAGDGQTEKVLALISAGADIHEKVDSGLTPLHVAAYMGQTETALALASTGADINARVDSGFTSLHMAANAGQVETALALVSAGADINARDDDTGSTPLHVAANAGQTEAVLALVSAGADIHARGVTGGTPLGVAVWAGQPETVIALISVGADIHERNVTGGTPLHLAAYAGQTETALALISAGADIHAMDYPGATPLFVAIMRGHTETAQVLTDHTAP